MSAKNPVYRVFIGQVNQTWIEARASSAKLAAEKAYRKWRSNEGHSHVIGIEISPNKKPQSP